jgi:hypothetical protein
MLTAGILLWANLDEREYGVFKRQDRNAPFEVFYEIRLYHQGWPFIVQSELRYIKTDEHLRIDGFCNTMHLEWLKDANDYPWIPFSSFVFFLDIIVALLILFTVSFGCEQLTRLPFLPRTNSKLNGLKEIDSHD